MKGLCTFYTETGTEGGYWAFQDEQFISYDGLHILKNGDILIIYSKDNPKIIVWSGVISLKQYEVFTQDASGMRIHADQKGIDRDEWAKFFFKEFSAELWTM